MKIGWACVDVTPSRPVILRGQFHARISQRVNDPLTATAMAVEGPDGRGGQDQAVVISLDHVGIPRDLSTSLRRRVAAQTPDLDAAKVFVHCTHTHTGPTVTEGQYPPAGPEAMTPTECAEQLLEGLTAAAVSAWQDRRDGAISRAFGHAVVGHNRRAVFRDGISKMYARTHDEAFERIEGYEDHGVDLLFTWDAARRLRGVVVNLACPSQVTENALYISADFWHETRQAIRRRHGEGLFILPQCAPAGDQSPHFLLYGPQEAFMRDLSGLSEREVLGRRIARAVAECVELAGKAVQNDPIVRHVAETVELPARSVSDEQVASARTELARLEAERPTDERAASRKFVFQRRAREVIARYEQQGEAPTYAMELHALRLGDVAMVTNPFELFLDYGLRIKACSPAGQTFAVQLACDYAGYVPTARAVAGGGYGAEIASNRVGPAGGDVLVERTLAAIQRVWE